MGVSCLMLKKSDWAYESLIEMYPDVDSYENVGMYFYDEDHQVWHSFDEIRSFTLNPKFSLHRCGLELDKIYPLEMFNYNLTTIDKKTFKSRFINNGATHFMFTQ